MGKRRMFYRIWWSITPARLVYRVVPDVLEHTPRNHDNWVAATGQFSCIATAVAYITARNATRESPYTIEVVPITLSMKVREHEADSIARVDALERTPCEQGIYGSRTKKKVSKKVTKKVTRKATPFVHDPGPRMPHGDPLMPPPLLP